MLLSLLSKRSLDADSRDAFGFAVRPQHLKQYREYSEIYKLEEGERSEKWKNFLEHQVESSVTNDKNITTFDSEATKQESDDAQDLREGGNNSAKVPANDNGTEVPASVKKESRVVRTWCDIRSSLNDIDSKMSIRINKNNSVKDKEINTNHEHLPPINEVRHSKTNPEMENEDNFNENETVDDDSDREKEMVDDSMNTSQIERTESDSFPWLELEFLVHGGVPRELRGEVWQAFVGVKTRRVEKYYQNLLDCGGDDGVAEKYRKQIEKDLPRTFPGHPALDENGRNSLRRVLLAYAQHNPSVGYCQAMNFFAGLLLLMMPEENAFWTLVGILDDYFAGCYTQEMIESQVDQLVFEDLIRERFPKLVNHLDYLGVQVTWITGPWFLSIFVNIIPWESVLRVWDVILFEGNRVMMFRTALALMELYGPTVVTSRDAGDAIIYLQTLTGSTFDSSQLVLTACMGFNTVTQEKLEDLRKKHRPSVLGVIEERSKGTPIKDPKGLATKLCSFKHNSRSDLESMAVTKETKPVVDNPISPPHLSDSHPSISDEILQTIEAKVDSIPELQDQIIWLKAEICEKLEEKRAAELRAEELETALMEMVKEDNRRQLTAKIEQLEQEVSELRDTLALKKEQETTMLEVLMRVEHEQKVNEEARIFAEQEAATQKYELHVLQEKYEKAMVAFAQMEKRVVMAESMLEATLQYQSGQNKALLSPGPQRPESPVSRTGLFSFGLAWRDRTRGQQSSPLVPAPAPAPGETKSANDSNSSHMQSNGHQE